MSDTGMKQFAIDFIRRLPGGMLFGVVMGVVIYGLWWSFFAVLASPFDPAGELQPVIDATAVAAGTVTFVFGTVIMTLLVETSDGGKPLAEKYGNGGCIDE